MLALFSAASGLLVGSPMMHTSRCAAPMMATVGEMLATMEGPDLYWEKIGPLQNPPKEESDFKEYDSFSMFLEACSAGGVDLSAPDITVFAPGNKAVAEYTAVYGPLTKEVCAYHVVKGVVPSGSLSSTPLATASVKSSVLSCFRTSSNKSPTAPRLQPMLTAEL